MNEHEQIQHQKDLMETEKTIRRFAERCLIHSNYIVTAYIKDEQSMAALSSIIQNVAADLDHTQYIINDEGHFFKMENGSVFSFLVLPVVDGYESHVVIMDNRIRQNEIDTIIKPRIIQYVTPSGGAMLNPRLIYIRFMEATK